MSAAQQMLLGSGGAAGDPYYANVSLLLHMDGSNGSTTFTDNSPSPKTVAAFGNAQVSTSVAKYGTGSAKFNGSVDYLTSTEIGTSNDLGNGDFTVECWINFTVVQDSGIVSGQQVGEFDFAFMAPNELRVGRINIAWDAIATGFTPSTGVWYHVAFARAGTTLRIFVNGTQLGSSFTNSIGYNAGNLYIGYSRPPASDRPLNGYIDDLRITKGVARYTANFTPPAAAFPNS
jgi:hypothetical protein